MACFICYTLPHFIYGSIENIAMTRVLVMSDYNGADVPCGIYYNEKDAYAAIDNYYISHDKQLPKGKFMVYINHYFEE